MPKARVSRPSSNKPNKRQALRQEPVRFVDPFDNRILLGYLYDVTQWHGYVRFLGLPQLRDNPDLPLQELFVEPYISRSRGHLDLPSAEWREVQPSLQAILENPRLVLLGDPGSGKSTLINFVAGQLSQPRSNLWQAALGPFIPIPMILRELKLDVNLTGDRLIEAFLAHPVAEKLRSSKELLYTILRAGQGYLLLDGLDEIGNLEIRKSLRTAVLDLVDRFPTCRFLLTSRIVGYEEVPFHSMQSGYAEIGSVESGNDNAWAELRYVAPFSDAQIEQFSFNWYSSREAISEIGESSARDLVAALHGSESTLRLARIPNLLTLMALIHRVQRRLPYGRVVLYDKIAEAYLESIDVFRGIHEVNYPLFQKRRWLSYVGFQMQHRRSEAAKSNDSGARGVREVLVDQKTVQAWVMEAMQSSALGANSEAASAFLDYISRRSGLLLPRGEGLFAFTHLSFQEYFAACYLAEQVNSPRWLKGRAAPGTGPQELVSMSGKVEWRETLVLLFEILADRPDWVEVLLSSIFGEEYKEIKRPATDRLHSDQVQLLAEIAIDPYSGMTESQRASSFHVCWEWEIERQRIERKVFTEVPVVAQRLTTAEQQARQEVWRVFGSVLQKLKPLGISLKGCYGVVSGGALQYLGKCKSLMALDISKTDIVDLAPLAGLDRLVVLQADDTAVSDLRPIAGHHLLKGLGLNGTKVVDLAGIENLKNLHGLSLGRTKVADLSAISELRNLEYLVIYSTNVADLNVLAALARLERLVLRRTKVTDLSSLSGIMGLKYLDASHTSVTDVSPLSNLFDLRDLKLDGTGVTDLSPLMNLQNLEEIDLSWTSVESLEAIGQLRSLRKLHLFGVSIPEEEVEAIRSALPGLEIVR